jgi:hypothetical protein
MQHKDESEEVDFSGLFPELTGEDKEEANMNMGNYIKTVMRIMNAAFSDPSRRATLAAIYLDLPRSDEKKIRELHAKRAARGANAPVPLDELMAETKARKPDLLLELVAHPALAYKLAVGPEKRELLLILIEKGLATGKEVEFFLRKPFDVIAKRHLERRRETTTS